MKAKYPIVTIKGRTIANGAKPFVIAELSGNHQQSYELAIEMIEAAAEAGADAIKLQTYTADSMTLDCMSSDFLINESDSLWTGQKLYDLYAIAATPYAWHKGLFEKARALGMLAFSSPFDEHAVDFLETLDVPCYKIASFENNDLPLIRKVASTGKPLIISTGMASLEELNETVACAREAGCRDLILLKCTSAYPAPAQDMNLITMQDMLVRFNCPTGLSDHTLGNEIAFAATTLGAAVIEKHFVLDRGAGGVDAAFSLEPLELKTLCEGSARIVEAMGSVNYGQNVSDRKASRYRRSIYFAKSLEKGNIVTEDDVRIVRPGLGLPPKFIDQVVGKTLKENVAVGCATRWDLFE